MKIIHKLLKILTTLIQNPETISRVLLDDSEKKKVQNHHGLTHGLLTIDILELCPNFQTTVNPYSFLDGTSPVMDIALLNSLAAQLPNCDYLEIGSWRGESIANVAKFAKQCVSVSLSPAEMKAFGLSEKFISLHNFFSKGIDNIKHIGHNSLTFDFSTLGMEFDLIFIDGDHTYPGVKSDTENAFKLLKNEQSIIVWHDYGRGTEDVRWDVLAGILDGCPEEYRKNLYHVSNTMSAIFTRSEFDTSLQSFPSTPSKSFKISIEGLNL